MRPGKPAVDRMRLGVPDGVTGSVTQSGYLSLRECVSGWHLMAVPPSLLGRFVFEYEHNSVLFEALHAQFRGYNVTR
jgi:hypothetical protein